MSHTRDRKTAYVVIGALMMVAFLVIIIGAGTGTAALPGWQTLFRRSETADRVEMTKGTALTGGMGKLPVVQVMDAVADADSDDVLAATAIPTGASALSVITSGISDPDVYRNVTATGSASGANGCIVTVYGTDWAGKAVSEAITLTGASTVQGNRPFAAINMITVGGVGSPGGATASVGIGEKLGLYRPIGAASDVSQVAHKATDGTTWTLNTGGQLPAGASVSADYGTVDPETTIGDADGYMITYNAAAW